MIVSLNEIESLVFKACRGGSMSWGLAEEAAQAARWLAARQIPWECSLLFILSNRELVSRPSLAGQDIRAVAPGRALCPIHAGAVVSDLLALSRRLVFFEILAPLWLLPFAARHVRGRTDVALVWPGGSLQLGRLSEGDCREMSGLTGARIPNLVIEVLAAELTAECAMKERPHAGPVDDVAWGQLLRFAATTYVPASDQSRTTGAGAALLDND
jgi:hypothetical protein